MKVFVSGATGLVGAHSVLALVKAGFQVRLLVRNAELARDYFQQHGLVISDIVVGDMCDKALVKSAMQGCDAVLHAAAMVSLDPKLSDEIYKNNIAGIDSVLGAAIALNIGHIIYVSSLAAFFNPKASIINEESSLGVAKDAYMRSKRDCEIHVRQLQAQGAAIKISYPSGVFSPHDPKLSESNASIKALLTTIPITSSGIQFIDARDLAQLHVKLLQADSGADRIIAGGHFYPWKEFHQLMENVTARSIPHMKIPGFALRIIGHLMDIIKRIYPINTPIGSESMQVCTQFPRADSSKAEKSFSLAFRPAEETLSDTIQWMSESGFIKSRYAGKLNK